MNSTLNAFVKQSWAGLRAMLVFTVLFGLLYPAIVWGVGQVVARDQSTGSLVSVDGTVVGSSLVGQQWTGAQWFWGRPSASAYSGDTSGGSNLSGSALSEEVAKRASAVGLDPTSAPADALTASGSGLDPDISPAYAESQVARVAGARGLPVQQVADLVAAHTKGRVAGFLGEPRVNVLELNLALDRLVASRPG
ncbi:potassium transporter KtrA [Intrasporangium oryzae NRRL B-24470]|uniref:Potassium-transporting ATPase KdpC subunit n=1 Tax=Intrasporangium oryzae NRRL B-24470 TaxID=1386089 RepID=W9GB98_9MICO|nr:potassium-transporting ATPase subunit KdpC [Intrasporangium oryzae]EWT03481.1 potassium transporter KtrA [Intrasporangium oryzae NRRL B-24470]